MLNGAFTKKLLSIFHCDYQGMVAPVLS